MITKGDFRFLEFKHRDAGSWTPKGSIEKVEYDEAYILRIGEVTPDGDLYEGQFKIAVTEADLIEKLSKFKPFDSISIEMYVFMKKDKCALELKDVITPNTDSEVTTTENGIKNLY